MPDQRGERYSKAGGNGLLLYRDGSIPLPLPEHRAASSRLRCRRHDRRFRRIPIGNVLGVRASALRQPKHRQGAWSR
jgi:hypothetical protein